MISVPIEAFYESCPAPRDASAPTFFSSLRSRIGRLRCVLCHRLGIRFRFVLVQRLAGADRVALYFGTGA